MKGKADRRGRTSPFPLPDPALLARAVAKVGPDTPYALGALVRRALAESA